MILFILPLLCATPWGSSFAPLAPSLAFLSLCSSSSIAYLLPPFT